MLERYVGRIDVIPCRQTGFEEQDRSDGVGEHDAVEFHPHVAVRPQRVDS